MTKKKLWGIIDRDLRPGNYTVVAENNYKIGGEKISKGIELTPSSIVGGKLYSLPITLMVLGVASWIYTFYLIYKFREHEELLRNYRNENR